MAAVDLVDVDESVGVSGYGKIYGDTLVSVLDSVKATRLVNSPIQTLVVVTGDGGTPKGRARIVYVVDIAASPSAYDIAQAVWAATAAGFNTAGTMGEKLNDAGSASNPWTEVIESGYTAAEILRLLAAVSFGKTNIVDNGGGSATVTFRDLADTKDRVDADMVGSERQTVTLDAS
jgi:hypothetical protein